LRFLVEDPPSYKKGIFLQGEMCRFKGICCADFRIYSVRGDYRYNTHPPAPTWGNTPLKNLTQKVSPEKYICIFYIRFFLVGSLLCPSFLRVRSSGSGCFRVRLRPSLRLRLSSLVVVVLVSSYCCLLVQYLPMIGNYFKVYLRVDLLRNGV